MPVVGQRRAPWPPWAHPAIVILFITGCFHLYRGAPLDGTVFLGATAWLAVLETRSPAGVVGPGEPPSQFFVLVGALVAAVLTAAPRYGDADVVVVGVVGLAALVVAFSRGDDLPPVRDGRAWPYAVVGLVAALNELTAYLLETSPAAEWRHPAFSDVLDPAFAWAPTRGLLVVVWLAGGWWLLRAMPARLAARDAGEPHPGRGAP